MTTQELQDHNHVYSMFSFRDGRNEPGICINRYNLVLGEIEYYFVPQENMQAYKNAFEKYDRAACAGLCSKIDPYELINVKQVMPGEYQATMHVPEINKIMNARQ